MARCSRRLAWAALLAAWTCCASGSRYAAGRPQHDAHAAPRARVPGRRLSRSAPLLLAAVPLLAGAQFPELEAEFGLLDADGDGLVSKQEFVFRTRGLIESQGTSDEDEIMDVLQKNAAHFDDADLNGDGKLDMREVEYLGYLADLMRALDGSFDYEKLVKKVFDSVDRDQDGKVDQDELLLHLLTSRGPESLSELDHAIVSDIFSYSDLDGDGSLNVQELQYASWRSERILGARSDSAKDPLHELAIALYHFWDGDRDGILTVEELREAAEMHASQDVRVSPTVRAALEKAQEQFARYDADGDGRWDTQEAAYFVGAFVNRRNDALHDGL